MYEEDITCLYCHKGFEVEINESGKCPKCGEEYYWDDNSDGTLVIYWESLSYYKRNEVK